MKGMFRDRNTHTINDFIIMYCDDANHSCVLVGRHDASDEAVILDYNKGKRTIGTPTTRASATTSSSSTTSTVSVNTEIHRNTLETPKYTTRHVHTYRNTLTTKEL